MKKGLFKILNKILIRFILNFESDNELYLDVSLFDRVNNLEVEVKRLKDKYEKR